MAKKVKITITIDSEVLAGLDLLVRSAQKKELEVGRLTSNRSSVIEAIVRKQLGKK